MANVTVRRTEHFKVGDFSFVELSAEVSEEFDDRKKGLQEVHKDIRGYMNALREQFKKEFEDGAFDL